MTARAWSGGRLIAAAAVLAAAGLVLLYAGAHGIRPAADATVPRVTGPARLPGPAGPSAAVSVAPPSPRASAGSASSAAPAVPGPTRQSTGPGDGSAVARELPPPESGPAADPIIQQALDQASPPDLPPDDERQLLELGRQAWTAETAGYTQVRVQAATARRDTAATGGGERTQVQAVVRLVWAGADPAGTFLDGRTATLHYTQNGQGSWNRT
ncbi:hypothetical protein [Streptomyces sp. NPDC002287]